LSEKNKREIVQIPRWVWFMVWCWTIGFTLYVVPHSPYYRINYQQIAPYWFDGYGEVLFMTCSTMLLLTPISYSLSHCLQSLFDGTPTIHTLHYLKPLLLVIIVFFIGTAIANHRYNPVDREHVRGDQVVLYRSWNFFTSDYNYRLYWRLDGFGSTSYLMGEYHTQDNAYQLHETATELLITTGENIVDKYEVFNGWVCDFAPLNYKCRTAQNSEVDGL
jgi:hypothetical protein